MFFHLGSRLVNSDDISSFRKEGDVLYAYFRDGSALSCGNWSLADALEVCGGNFTVVPVPTGYFALQPEDTDEGTIINKFPIVAALVRAPETPGVTTVKYVSFGGLLFPDAPSDGILSPDGQIFTQFQTFTSFIRYKEYALEEFRKIA